MDFVSSGICSAEESQRGRDRKKTERRNKKRTMACEIHVEGSIGLTNRENQLSHYSEYLNVPCILKQCI